MKNKTAKQIRAVADRILAARIKEQNELVRANEAAVIDEKDMTGEQYVAAIEANRVRVAREYKEQSDIYNAKPAKHKIITNKDGTKTVVKL